MAFRMTQSRDFIGDTIGEDTILINLRTGAYYSLTPLGGAVWAKVLAGENTFSPEEVSVLSLMTTEGVFEGDAVPLPDTAVDASIAFLKYTEMSELLLADPIHEVDEDGWPKLR